jgi:hypothetical protein
MFLVNLLFVITKSFVPSSRPNYIYHQTKFIEKTIMQQRSDISFHSFLRSIAITNCITTQSSVDLLRSLATKSCCEEKLMRIRREY